MASTQAISAFDQLHRYLRPQLRKPVGNQAVSKAAARQEQRRPRPRGEVQHHPRSWTEKHPLRKHQPAGRALTQTATERTHPLALVCFRHAEELIADTGLISGALPEQDHGESVRWVGEWGPTSLCP